MGPKIIYLAERNAKWNREAWLARWREHGELNRSLPIWAHIWRYEQDRAVAMPDPVRAVVPGPLDDEVHPGVGQVWCRSEKARKLLRDEPCREQIVEDEVKTFGRSVDHFALSTSEQQRRESEPTTVKLVLFLMGPEQSTRERFWSSWRACMGEPALASLFAASSAYIESPASSSAAARAGEPARDAFSAYDGVVEFGFRDLSALTGAVESGDVAAAWERIGEQLDRSRSSTLLVEQGLLYDELEEVDWPFEELLALRREQVRALA
jgi:hypothetical protein